MADNFLNLSGLTRFKSKIDELLSGKQGTLTAGDGITIDNNVISADGEVFVAVYEQTPYADVKAAIDAHKAIVLDMPANNNQFCITFATYTNGGNALMYAIYKMNDKPTLMTVTLTPQNQWTISHTDLQDKLVSGDNIKTINNQSLLGQGNIDIQGGGSGVFEAEYGVTSYTDIAQAVSAKKSILVKKGATTQLMTGEYPTSLGSPITLYTIGGYSLNTENPVVKFFYYLVFSDNTWKLGTRNINPYTLATENYAGTIKLNPSQNIDVNANGQLTVGGRIGQFEGTTGLFAPNNRAPRNVLDYSLLITDALGMDMSANRSLADVSGYGLACKSAAAGSTQYRISNTYANRILAKLCEGGYASRDEATSKVEQIIPVTSVKIGGSSYTPDSSANDSSNDIVITTAQTLNPDNTITNIRLFGKMQSYASLHVGNGIKSESGGRSLVLGGGVTKVGSTNDNCLVGNGIYSSGNGNACFGRNHIARKNRGLLAGSGHDTTNARSEGASAVGEYSYMDANTLFAVGNGSSHTDRKNAFEVRTDGIVLRSSNGTRYKLTIDDGGTLSVTAVT